MKQESFYKMSTEEKKVFLIKVMENLKNEKASTKDDFLIGLSNGNVNHDDAEKFKPFPLSDIQESFYSGRFLGKKKDNVGCHIYCEFEEYDLDVTNLFNAWASLIEYHEMLRMVVLHNATQKVQKEVEIPPFKIYDLTEKTEEKAHQIFNKVRQRLSHKVYAPGQWPLFEIVISRFKMEKYIIHFSIDEWLTDGFSMSILLKQWYNLYKDNSYELPIINYSFREYVLNSKLMELDSKFQKDIEYWKAIPIFNGPDLPYSQPMAEKPEGQNCYFRKRYHRVLEAEYWNSLKRKCLEAHISPTTLLLTVFSDLLSIHSKKERFSIILTLFNRMPLHQDVDKIVGPFISTQFFDIERNLEENTYVKAKNYQKKLWSHLDHGSVSGIRILRERKDKSSNIDLQVPIVFTSMINKSGSEGKGSWLEKMNYSISQTPQVYLDHQVYEYQDALHLNWDAVEEAFQPGILSTMIDSYYELLRNLALNSDYSPISATKNGYPSLPEKKEIIGVKDSFTLTPLQKSYYLSKKMGDSALIYQEFEISNFSIIDLEQAWQKVISHHEMLQVVISEKGNFQKRVDLPRFRIDVKDFSHDTKEVQHIRLEEIRDKYRRKRFDYREYPWYSLSLSVLGATKAILHICIDGIVADGTSIGLLYRQLFDLYQHPSKTLVKNDYSYSDYRDSVETSKIGPEYAKAITSWTTKFKNLASGPKLPKSSFPSKSKKHLRLKGQLEDWVSLKETTRALGVTEDALLFTLYAVALAEFCEENLFSIIYVDWERLPMSKDIMELVGDFTFLSWVEVNTSIGSLEELVRYNHNQIQKEKELKPFCGLEVMGKILLQKERNFSFPVVYTNVIYPQDFDNQDTIQPGYGFSQTPHVLIDNMSYEKNGILYYSWDVPLDTFPKGWIEKVFSSYQRLLSIVVKTGDWRSLDVLELTMPDYTNTKLKTIENQMVVANDEDLVTSTLEPLGLDKKTIHGQFETQAALFPTRTSIVFEQEHLSYKELNERSNKLARYLQKIGAGPEKKIVIFLERSVEMLVSILGVLKSGAAYVPLDITLPKERLSLIVDDSDPLIIICQKENTSKLPENNSEIVELGREWELIELESEENVCSNAIGSNLAYIIYTSGTTGRPKGTLVCHYNVVRLFSATHGWYQFNEEDVWTLFHSFTFDFSVWEIFGALFYGGKLIIVPYAVSRSFKRFYNLLCEEKVTVLNQTPTAFRQLNRVEEQLKEAPQLSLRYVIFGGEMLNFANLKDWFQRHGDQRPKLINMYGITETTVHVTYRPLTKEDVYRKESVIGVPIPDLSVQILDANQRPVARGFDGEMYVGGLGVTRGYLNRTELNKERFIEDSYSGLPGGKLYRTGDLGKILDNGEIVYLGRIDSQVKVRGFRIELKDIENTLIKHPVVKEATVCVQDAGTENPLLVAYVIPNKDDLFSEKEIRKFSRTILPDYMVPNNIISIDEFPLNHNGKLDIMSLPWKNEAVDDTLNEIKAKDKSQDILSIIGEILNNKDIRLEDDIFDLGATSLSLILLSQHIEQYFGKEIRMEFFLERTKIIDIVNFLKSSDDTIENKENLDKRPLSFEPPGINTKDRDSSKKSPVLTQTVAIFKKILQIEEVVSTDDIFDLGSTSLTLIFAIEEIENQMGVSLPMELFLETTTIKGIANNINQLLLGLKSIPEYVDNEEKGNIFNDLSIEGPNGIIQLQKYQIDPLHFIFGKPQYEFLKERIPFSLFSQLLSLLRSNKLGDRYSYLYPSAGGKNSIQTYLYTIDGSIEDVSGGLYYYNPVEHQLYLVNGDAVFPDEIHHQMNKDSVESSAFQLFFVAQLNAMKPIYMDYSQELVTLEIGYMTQLLLSRQAEFGFGLLPVQGVDYLSILKDFYPDDGHVILGCFLGGLVDYEHYEKTPNLRNVTIQGRNRKAQYNNLDSHFKSRPDYRSFESVREIQRAKQFKPLSPEEQKMLAKRELHLRNFPDHAIKVPLLDHSFAIEEYKTRSSKRQFVDAKIPGTDFSKFMQLIRGMDIASGCTLKLYSSVGTLYSVKTYLYIRKGAIENIEEGLYHYKSDAHVLKKIKERLSVPLEQCHTPFNLITCRKASFFIFFVVDTDRVEQAYGPMALDFVFKEAGHIGQLLMDHQSECNIGVMPVGGMVFDKVKEDFGLGPSQQMLHSLMGGKVDYDSHRNTKLNIYSPEPPAYLNLNDISSFYKKEDSLSEASFSMEASINEETPDSSSGIHPLSYGQRSLWFIYKNAPGSYAYNSGFHVQIESQINDDKLKEAIQILVNRHEMLRVNFVEKDGSPFQIIQPELTIEPKIIDATGWEKSEVIEKIELEYKVPFDLENGPVMKMYVYHISPECHFLFLNLHHIVTDFYSTSMLIQELLDTYSSLVKGDELDVDEATSNTTYLDFVYWQKKMLDGEQGKKLLEQWKEMIGTCTPEMKLPTDFERPLISSNRGGTVPFQLDKDLYIKYKNLAKREKCTLFMVFLSTFCVLLAKYALRDNVVLGTLVTARGNANFNRTLGYFINPVVLSMKMNNDNNFIDLLKNVKRRILMIIKNQDYPFPLLVEKLRPKRNANVSPLFQVTFQFLNSQIQDSYSDEAKWYNESLKLKSFEMLSQEGQFDLELEMFEGIETIKGKWMYNSDLFSDTTVNQISVHFTSVLHQILENPNQPLKQISILTPKEMVKKKDLEKKFDFNL